MPDLNNVLNASAQYWISRISALKAQIPDEQSFSGEENPELARSLLVAVDAQLEVLKNELSDLRVTQQHTFDGTVKEVLTLDIMVSSIEVQVTDYLTMIGGASPQNPSSQTTSSGSPFKRFLNGLVSALGSLQQWLLSILRIATTLKEWTISGGVSAGSLGLASAKLSITFGP